MILNIEHKQIELLEWTVQFTEHNGVREKVCIPRKTPNQQAALNFHEVLFWKSDTVIVIA